MAKRKIEWTNLAQNLFNDILTYYAIRNGNKKYSNKLSKEIKKLISYLQNNPFLGKATEFENNRMLIFENYKIFYEIENDMIFINFIWDSRRNPEDLEKYL